MHQSDLKDFENGLIPYYVYYRKHLVQLLVLLSRKHGMCLWRIYA